MKNLMYHLLKSLNKSDYKFMIQVVEKLGIRDTIRLAKLLLILKNRFDLEIYQ